MSRVAGYEISSARLEGGHIRILLRWCSSLRVELCGTDAGGPSIQSGGLRQTLLLEGCEAGGAGGYPRGQCESGCRADSYALAPRVSGFSALSGESENSCYDLQVPY
jgi:hypothetical protein